VNEKEATVARPRKQLPVDLVRQGAVLRARRALIEVDELRFVSESVKAGAAQGAVADALGASQATVSRIIRKVADNPSVLRPSVTEIVGRAAARQITRSQMLDDLRHLKIVYVSPDKSPTSEWAKLRDAYRHGLLSKSETRLIAEDTAARLIGRVTHSMDLEAQHVPSEGISRMQAETTEKLMADL
jgi:hypothetical protein